MNAATPESGEAIPPASRVSPWWRVLSVVLLIALLLAWAAGYSMSEQYKAQIEAGMSQVKIYEAQVGAAKTLVELEQAKIGAAGEQGDRGLCW